MYGGLINSLRSCILDFSTIAGSKSEKGAKALEREQRRFSLEIQTRKKVKTAIVTIAGGFMLHLTSMVCLHVGIHVLFWYILAMSWLTLWTGEKELSPVRISAEVFIGIGLSGTFLSILSSMADGIGFTDAVVPFLPLFGLLVLDVLALIYMRSSCRRQLVCLAQNRLSK